MLLFICRALPLICAFGVLGVSSSWALDKDSVKETILRSYNLELEALDIVDSLIVENPDHPLGYLIKMSQLYWLNVYTKYDLELKEEFELVSKQALKVGKSYASDHEEDIDAEFYLGMIELGMARYYIDEGKWFQSFLKVRPGLKRMRRLLEEHPDYHDAKQALGLANCYVARAPGYLKPLIRLLSSKGDFEYGLRLLEECKEFGSVTKYESSIYLADVADELLQDPVRARQEMETLVEAFPNNVYFQRELAIYEERTGQQDRALARYEAILDLPNFNQYSRICFDVYTRLGQTYMSRKNADKALQCTAACLAEMEGLDAEGVEYTKGWILLVKAAAFVHQERFEEAKTVYALVGKKPNARAYELAQLGLDELEKRADG